MMDVLTRIIPVAAFAAAAPVLAHCGKCGKTDEHADPASAKAHAEVGKPAPDFELLDINGKKHSLADHEGMVVVLEWINHECPVSNRYCKSGIMKNTLAKFKDKPVVWLGVDSSHFCEEKAESIRKWVAQNGVEYPILLDAPGKIGHLYDAKTTPHVFVIDQKGVLAYAGAVDDDPYGNKNDRRNYVEEAVTALLSGSAVATASTKPVGCTVKYKS